MSSTAANVNGAVQNLNYNPLFRSGYQDNGYTLGLALDVNKNPIYVTNDMTSFQNVTCKAGSSFAGVTAPSCPTGFTSLLESTANNLLMPAGAVVPACPTPSSTAGSWIAGCNTATASTVLEISNYPDYMSLLSVNNNLYSIVQFESTPAMMYMTQVVQNANGVLSAKPGTLVPVDFSAYGGLSRPCAGSTTPWQTHLGSEETIMVNARDFEATFYGSSTSVGGSATYATVGYNSLTTSSGMNLLDMVRYFGEYPATVTTSDVATYIDPYMYGFINEVKIVGGLPVATKHMAMGRNPWEMAYVMPDQKTVYGGVDADNAGWYKYVANTAGDLSAGTLSCAVFNQTSPAGGAPSGAAFNIAWVSMGATSDAAAMSYVGGANGVNANQITFSDIFNVDVPTSSTSGACNTGFTSVNTGYSYKIGSTTYYNECLRLNPNNANAAAQAAMFETARYAGMLGCTTEFSKWEGITFSPARNQLYASLSYWTKGAAMSTNLVSSTTTVLNTTSNSAIGSPSTSITPTAVVGTTTVTTVGATQTTITVASLPNTADIGGSQDLNMGAGDCGCVMYINVDSTYSATSMGALVCGVKQTADSNGNTCTAGSISSPDNVAFVSDFDTLIIGEDTGTRRTDYVWEYTFPNAAGSTTSPAGGILTPIFTTMYGAESTSPYWQKAGNNGYLSLVIQHPYGESDWAFASTSTSSGVWAWMGFVGPINLNAAPAPAASAAPAAARAAVAALAAAFLALLL